MVRRSSQNQTTALVRFRPTPPVWSSGSTELITRFVIVQRRRALAIDLLIGLGLPLLNVILCTLIPLYSSVLLVRRSNPQRVLFQPLSFKDTGLTSSRT